jgi:hypothetical protein
VDLLSSPWFFALIALFIGIGIGIFIHSSKYSDDNQTHKLKSEIQSLEQEFEQYKISVSDHFSTTSTLVNELTENYVKVYQHLSEGSQSLADADQTPLSLGLNSEPPLASVINRIEASSDKRQQDDDMEVPRDYAPKPATADAQGTLSEAFSINTDKHATEEVLEPAKQKLA